MADTRSVIVPIEVFNAGSFPPVCSETGVPTQEKRSLKAERIPPIVILGVFGGFIGIAILAEILKKTAEGAVPYVHDPDVARKRRMRISVSAATGCFFLLLTIVLSGTPAIVCFFGFMAGMISALFFTSRGQAQVKASLAKDQRTVTLNKAHPAFVEATIAMLETRTNLQHREAPVLAGNPIPTEPPLMPTGDPIPIGAMPSAAQGDPFQG